jgi:uncharacterized protein (TIGR00725 family)
MMPAEANDNTRILRISVGVMGSAGGDLNRETLDKAFRMGEEIARRGCVLITGACPGLPHQAVLGARKVGGTVVGISPALNFEEHAMKYASPYHGYDAIIYTGSGLMGREIENIRSCDMVVFMGGRSGTLGEFAIAYDEAKVIGVLKGTGGITDKIETIISFIQKNTGAQVVYSEDPKDLLDRLMEVYNQSLLPYYKTILANSSPDGDLEP